MRVIGGRLSGRTFDAPDGRTTRPTSDRVREGLGSALDSRGVFSGARVLDLFAGSGALSFEALSRGAVQAVLVDRDLDCVKTIKANATTLGLDDLTRVVRLDLSKGPAPVVEKIPAPEGGFDLVFSDAPYKDSHLVNPLLDALVLAKRLRPNAWVVVEHDSAQPWSWNNVLAPAAEYRYGQTSISVAVYEWQ